MSARNYCVYSKPTRNQMTKLTTSPDKVREDAARLGQEQYGVASGMFDGHEWRITAIENGVEIAINILPQIQES